jgi:hypothetical protein
MVMNLCQKDKLYYGNTFIYSSQENYKPNFSIHLKIHLDPVNPLKNIYGIFYFQQSFIDKT